MPFNFNIRNFSTPASIPPGGPFSPLAVAGVFAGIFGIVILWDHLDRHTCPRPEDHHHSRIDSSKLNIQDDEKIKALKKDVEKERQLVSKSQTTLLSLRLEIEKSANVLESVRNENQELTVQVQRLAEELGEARRQSRVEDLQGDVAKLKKQLHVVESQLVSSRAQSANLESEKEAYKVRIQTLEELVEKNRSEYRKEHGLMKEQVGQRVKEVESAKREVERLQMTVKAVKAEAASSHAHETNALETQINHLKSELSSTTEQLTSQLKSSQLEIASQSQQITSLTQNLQRALADVHGKNELASSLQVQIQNLKNEGAAANAENHRLVENLDKARVQVQHQTDVVVELRKSIEESVEKLSADDARARSQLEQSQLEMARQAALVLELREQLERVLADVGLKTQVVSGLEKDLSISRETESTLHSQLESLHSETSRQSNLINSLREQLSHALSDVDAKSSLANELEKHVQALKSDQDSFTFVDSSHQIQIAQQIQTIDSLRQELEIALADVRDKSRVASELENELQVVKKEGVESKQHLQSSLSVEITRVHTLSADLERSRGDVDEKTRFVLELETALAEARKTQVETREGLSSPLESSRLELEQQSALLISLRRDLDQVRTDVQAKTQLASDLENELASTRKAEEESKLALESSQTELAHQSGLVSNLRRDLELVQSQVDAKTRAAIDLEKQLGEVKKIDSEAKDRLSSELETSQIEVARQSNLVTSLRQELELALSNVHAKTRAVESVEKELDNLKAEETESRQRLASELETRTARQEELISSLRQDLDRAFSEARDRIEVAGTLEKERAELQIRVEDYEAKLVGSNEACRVLEEEMKTVREEVKVHTREAGEKADEVERLIKQVDDVRREKEQKESEREKKSLELENALSVLKEREVEVSTLRETVGGIQAESATRLEELVGLKSTVEGLNKQIIHLKGEVDTKTSEERVRAETVEKKTREIEALHHKLGEREGSTHVLQKEVALAKSECERKQHAVEGAEREVEDLKNLVEELKVVVAKLEGEVDSKANEVEITVKEKIAVETKRDVEMTELNGEVERLRAEIAASQARLNGYKAEVEEETLRKSQEMASLTAEWKKKVETANASSTLRRSELDEAGQELSRAKEENENLKVLVNRSEEEAGDLRVEIARLNKLGEELRGEKAVLEKNSKALPEKYLDELRVLKNENGDLHVEVRALKDQAKNKEAEVEGLMLAKEDLERLSAELNKVKERADSAERSREAMKTEMESRNDELLGLQDAVRELAEVKAAREKLRGALEQITAKVEEVESQKQLAEKELEKKTEETDKITLEAEEAESWLYNMKVEIKTRDEKIEKLERELKKLTEEEKDSRPSSIRFRIDGDSDKASTSSSYTRVHASSLGSVGGAGDGASDSSSARGLGVDPDRSSMGGSPGRQFPRSRTDSMRSGHSHSSAEWQSRPLSQLLDGAGLLGKAGKALSFRRHSGLKNLKHSIPDYAQEQVMHLAKHDGHEHRDGDESGNEHHHHHHNHEHGIVVDEKESTKERKEREKKAKEAKEKEDKERKHREKEEKKEKEREKKEKEKEKKEKKNGNAEFLKEGLVGNAWF